MIADKHGRLLDKLGQHATGVAVPGFPQTGAIIAVETHRHTAICRSVDRRACQFHPGRAERGGDAR